MTIFSYFFWRITVPSNFLSVYPYLPPPPKKQSYRKDKLLKKRLGISVLFYIRTKSLCISRPPVKWSLFWLKISLFLCLCLFCCVPKEPRNTSLARRPALAYAVRILQDGTWIKVEELMPVRLSNRCKFILVRPVFILYMILESVREDKTQIKGHARDASGRENGLWSGNMMRALWFAWREKRQRVV